MGGYLTFLILLAVISAILMALTQQTGLQQWGGSSVVVAGTQSTTSGSDKSGTPDSGAPVYGVGAAGTGPDSRTPVYGVEAAGTGPFANQLLQRCTAVCQAAFS